MPFRCLNCPVHPEFSTMQGLEDHWEKTHTVAMVELIADPWNERPPKRIQHYEEVKLE
jgi:hypothetical protein